MQESYLSTSEPTCFPTPALARAFGLVPAPLGLLCLPPVRIEDKSLDAGPYSFFTIPGPDQWTFTFNETVEQWGAYNYDSTPDALRVQVEPEPAPKREMMSFYVHNVTDSTTTAFRHWDETRIPFEITVNITQILRSHAEEAVDEATEWKAPLRYVGYVLENAVLLDEALSWGNRENVPEPPHEGRRPGHDRSVNTATANAPLTTADGMEASPNGVEDFRKQSETLQSEM